MKALPRLATTSLFAALIFFSMEPSYTPRPSPSVQSGKTATTGAWMLLDFRTKQAEARGLKSASSGADTEITPEPEPQRSSRFDEEQEERQPTRTIDKLKESELAKMKELESRYFSEVRAEAVALVQIRFDISTILRTFPEQIRVVRQRKRQLLFNLELYLYSLHLNSNFIDSYILRVREDVLHYAMDEIIKKSNSMPGNTR